MIDWRIAAQVAETVASAQSTPDPAPFEAVTGPAEESERLVGAYTGLSVSGVSAPPCPRPSPSRGASGSTRTSARCAPCSTRCPVASAMGSGRCAGR